MMQGWGWAIINKDGRPVVDSVRRTRQQVLNWWLCSPPSSQELKSRWAKSTALGFSVRKVMIQEQDDA